MKSPRKRHDEVRSLRVVEFDGKYDLVMPTELRELPDEELVKLIMQRAKTDESRAREALATMRLGLPQRASYHRV